MIGPLPYGMDFLIKDNKTNDILLFGNKDWIHIYASDDQQFLAEISVITGLFISIRLYFPFFQYFLNNI